MSQSPSLRGSGRFAFRRYRPFLVLLVSIPFIAGQWSLPNDSPAFVSESPSCLNPLHCGAVVASARPTPPGAPTGACLNPLHCGAVVASRNAPLPRRGEGDVSIPFIAGQWSLPFAAEADLDGALNVSIPFIAGQWSLPNRR